MEILFLTDTDLSYNLGSYLSGSKTFHFILYIWFGWIAEPRSGIYCPLYVKSSPSMIFGICVRASVSSILLHFYSFTLLSVKV